MKTKAQKGHVTFQDTQQISRGISQEFPRRLWVACSQRRDRVTWSPFAKLVMLYLQCPEVGLLPMAGPHLLVCYFNNHYCSMQLKSQKFTHPSWMAVLIHCIIFFKTLVNYNIFHLKFPSLFHSNPPVSTSTPDSFELIR